MRHFYSFFATLFLTLFAVSVYSQQYTVNPVAIATSQDFPNSTCFRLTPAGSFHVAGSVWNNTQVNLNQSFTINTKLYFGANNASADGLAFVLQTAGTNALGIDGGGLGYYQIPGPSFVVEFDTWQNLEQHFTTGDPAGDHIAFMKNADVFHNGLNNLQGPTEFANNIEDGQWHDAIFSWDATTHTMNVQIFGQTYSYSGNIVHDIFGDNPMVYWGFTAGTGSIPGNEHGVCIITPPPPADCGQLHTQTPGGWGAEPHGNNPGTYLHTNFAAAFPNGLQVGCSANYSINLTTAQAITDLLPTGGKAAVLTGSSTNPPAIKNVLVGHLVALTLSTGFDAYDPDFGQAGITLGQMEIGSGTFAGWTVSDFLAEANNVLGGCSTNYTPAQVLETATAINENYVDGKMDGHFLDCPTNETGRMITGRRAAESQNITGFHAQPNPTRGQFQFQLDNKQAGMAQVQITNSNGTIVERKAVPLAGKGQTLRFDLSRQAAGIYLVRVMTSEGVQTQKIVLQK